MQSFNNSINTNNTYPLDVLPDHLTAIVLHYCPDSNSFESASDSAKEAYDNIPAVADLKKICKKYGILENIYYTQDQAEVKEKLSKVTHLDLRSLGLRTLPPELLLFPNLIGIDATGNQIECIPDYIGRFTKLSRLLLGRNQIKEVPNTVGELKELRLLSLECNQLEELPPSIDSMIKLVSLNLFETRIKHLSANLRSRRGLQINLRSTPLEKSVSL